MDVSSIKDAAFGGLLIGTSVTLMLLLHGKVTGITGIMVGATFERTRGDWLWRVIFLLGLVAGGAMMMTVLPESFGGMTQRSPALLVVAGLLVGFGARLGGGCTSGHGVCGISRFAPRSLVATAVFICTGMVTVLIARHLPGAFL